MRVRIKGVEGLDHHCDNHDDASDGQSHKDPWDEDLERGMPSNPRMPSPHQSLSKKEVDDVKDHDTSCNEDLSCYGQFDIALVVCPSDAECSRYHSYDAEDCR